MKLRLSHQRRIRFGFSAAIIILLTIPILSCTSHSRAIAEQGVSQFHTQYDSEQYHLVYLAADEAFRSATNESDFKTSMQEIREKLGKFQNSKLRSHQEAWFANTGLQVVLLYDTKFSNGWAVEQFAWNIRDGRAVLAGYTINSPTLTSK